MAYLIYWFEDSITKYKKIQAKSQEEALNLCKFLNYNSSKRFTAIDSKYFFNKKTKKTRAFYEK